MTVRNLDALLAPRSIVLVGASDRPGSVGATVWRNLRSGRFAGAVRAVNPSHRTLDGEPVFARVADLPAVPDLAVVCVPPEAVVRVIGELGAAGVRAAIVMTAGLGADARRAALEAARPHLLRVLGPDCIGMLAPHLGLNASVAHADALPGSLAFVAQSGALLTTVLDWTRARGIGLSHLVSLGDSLDVDVGDMLDYLASDPATRAILLHVESIESPRKFMSAARAAARNKPVIAVKAGRTGKGAQSGSDEVVDAALRRAGVLRVETLEELLLAAETLARFDGDTSRGLTVLANGHGAGVIAADAAARAGIELPALSRPLASDLCAVLPPGWSHANPVDIVADAPIRRYTESLRLLLADACVGTILLIHAPTALVRSDDIALACLPLLRQARHRVMACWLGAAAVAEARRIFEDAGVACYDTPEQAVRAFQMLATHRRNRALLLEAPALPEIPSPDADAARRIVAKALGGGERTLGEADARALLAAYGIPVATQRRTAGTGVADDGPGAPATAHRPRARALSAGIRVDATFGPVLLLGPGGGAAQEADERAVALPPLNRVLARELVDRARVARLLAGDPDRSAARIDAICDVLVALSRMLADLPELRELDIEPLWAGEDGAVAPDARVRLAPADAPAADRFAILPWPGHLAHAVRGLDQELLVRPILPEDEPLHRAFLERVSVEDLRWRFFDTRRELPRTERARLVQIDYAREMALVALRRDPAGGDEIVGVVRSMRDPDNVEAELAILVRSDLHGQGLGRLLMSEILAYQRAQGTRRMTAEVLSGNAAMHGLMRSAGFEQDARRADPGVTHYRLPLRP